jgi:thymidylate synthase (FAD)
MFKENKMEYSFSGGSVSYVDHMGTDLTVVNAARVSFDKESEWEVDTEAVARLEESQSKADMKDLTRLSDKDKKLINYLAMYNHWTPFAHPQITLRIKAPVSIRTQFFKHKQGFVENEISRRYVSNEPEFYHPKWRGAPTDGAKQGSSERIEIDEELDAQVHFAYANCARLYSLLIEEGVAPEQARFLLPQGMMTEWYWTGSLAAYARFYKQRSDPHAQWEIRHFADLIYEIIEPLFPASWKALTKEN